MTFSLLLAFDNTEHKYEPHMSLQSMMHMLSLLMALIFAYIERTEVIEKAVCLCEMNHGNELAEEAPQIQTRAPVPPHFHPSLL